MIREPEIKAAIIDALFEHQFVDGQSVVVSEMPVASWSRRADLVLANGKLVGFEIKSEADSTTRLVAQIEAYWTMMEGVTVVAAPKHSSRILRSIPSYAGYFEVEPVSGGVAISLVRKPYIRQLSVAAALSLMVLPDLIRLARLELPKIPVSLDRYSLENALRDLPPPVLRAAALSAVKARYRTFYEDFLRSRAASSSLAALPLLKRPRWSGAKHKLTTPEVVNIAPTFAGPVPKVLPRSLIN